MHYILDTILTTLCPFFQLKITVSPQEKLFNGAILKWIPSFAGTRKILIFSILHDTLGIIHSFLYYGKSSNGFK